MWKYQNNLPGDIFKKFPCTNPYENSWKTRSSLYLLRFNPECPKYDPDQIHISIGTYLCENIKKICLVIFLRNSGVLIPMRIRQNLELQYICSDWGHDCVKYGHVQIHISIGTHLCENIKRIFPVIFSINSRVLTPWEFVKNSNFNILAPIQVTTAPNMVVSKFIYP